MAGKPRQACEFFGDDTDAHVGFAVFRHAWLMSGVMVAFVQHEQALRPKGLQQPGFDR
ncbi:hypothetical protein D3C87_2008910 [compost metagenome]